MLKLFEKSTGIQAIVILAVTILLWMHALVNPQPMTPSASFAPLYSLLYSLSISPLLSVLIAIVLVIVGGILLNLMLVNAGLVSQNSLLPTLYYILFMSAGTETLSPTLIVGVLSIAFVRMLLLHSTLLTISSDKIFGATALIGLCSLFYLPSLALLLAYLLVAINYSLYSWRNWMVLLLGLQAPYLLLWAVFFMNGSLAANFTTMAAGLVPVPDFHLPALTLSVAANVFLLLTFAISLFVFWRHYGEKTTLWQKNASAVLMPTVTALALVFYSPLLPFNLQFLAIPFALSASLRFTADTRHYSRSPRNRHQWKQYLKDILFLIIIAAAIVC